MSMFIEFLAAHTPFFVGLAVGALLSPLLILAGLRAWDFFAPEFDSPRVQADAPRAERRRYRPHYNDAPPQPDLSPLQRAHLRKHRAKPERE